MSDLIASKRHDKAPVRVGATPVEVRPNGARIYEGVAAFGDIVKRYPDLDPPRNEFIPADEAMSPSALASLRGAIFTGGPRSRDWDGRVTLPADHPSDLSTPDTAGDLLEGVVLDAWRHDPEDGGYPELKVRVIAHTRPMQELIESGTCQLSLGMWTRDEVRPGVGPRCGTPYERIQRAIVYDHLNAVGAARSRTPDGRTARLDNDGRTDAPATYPRHGEKPTMDPALLDLLKSAFKMDALSPEGAALLAQMPPADQALLKAAAEAGMAEGAVEEVATEMGAEASGATDLAAVLSEIAALKAEVAALKGAKVDAPAPGSGDPAAAAAKMKKDAEALRAANPDPDRKDSAAMLTDPAAVIAAAQKAAAAAGAQAYNNAAAFVGHVRKDGHAANTTDEAATIMLSTIAEHLPLLKPIAEGHVKAQRLDALTPLYDQATSIKRDAMTRQQGEDVADIINPRNDAAGDSNTLEMFSAPVRQSRNRGA